DSEGPEDFEKVRVGLQKSEDWRKAQKHEKVQPAALGQAPVVPLQLAWTASCSPVFHSEDTSVYCVRWSADDQLLAAGCGDGVVRVFDPELGRVKYTLQRQTWRAKLPCTCLRFRPVVMPSKQEGNNEGEEGGEEGDSAYILLVSNADGTVQQWDVILWDLNEETSLRVLYGPHVCGDAIDVVGDQLLAGSWRRDDQVEVWHLYRDELLGVWSTADEKNPCQVSSCDRLHAALLGCFFHANTCSYIIDELTARD
ncbi:MAG: hypothetical protein SGPRY_015097, partial [Prymnesium sp.]